MSAAEVIVMAKSNLKSSLSFILMAKFLYAYLKFIISKMRQRGDGT